MKTGSGFVENEERGFLSFLSDEVGQFYTLVLTTGEGRGVLSEFYIAESYILQGFQSVDDCFLLMLAKELDCLRDGHVEYVVDILTFVAYIEDVVLETVTMTGFALQHQICHELHFYRDDACTLTLIAASAIGIE